MYKMCKTEQSNKRQRQIENCLFEILKEKHYEDITVSELCMRMNMPRKAFYRYFDCKEDVLSALIDHKMSEYYWLSLDRSRQTRRSLKRELEEYFIFWYDERELLSALDNSGLIIKVIDRTINFPISDRIVTAKFLPHDDERTRERVFKFAFAGLVYTMVEWYRDGFRVPTDRMAEYACRLLREPLFPNLGEAGIFE